MRRDGGKGKQVEKNESGEEKVGKKKRRGTLGLP